MPLSVCLIAVNMRTRGIVRGQGLLERKVMCCICYELIAKMRWVVMK